MTHVRRKTFIQRFGVGFSTEADNLFFIRYCLGLPFGFCRIEAILLLRS